MQHAWKHVERPGGSHEGVGRKKNLRENPSHWTQFDCRIHRMSTLQLTTMMMLGKGQLSGL